MIVDLAATEVKPMGGPQRIVPYSVRDRQATRETPRPGAAGPKFSSHQSRCHNAAADVSVRPVHGVLPGQRRRPGGSDLGQNAAAMAAVVLGGRGNPPDAGPESATGRSARPVADRSTADGDNEPEGMALFLAGTPMGPTLTGAGGFGSGLFEPMGEDRFGMRCGPAVG